MRRVTAAAAAVLLTLPTLASSAQEHTHPQGAPTGEFGTVHFPTSCRPTVAPQFDRAVAQLHSFEFGASIRTFNEVLAVDSTCAMAQWGIALSRWSNPMAAGNRSVAQLQQGKQSADAAMRLASHGSERERGYIHAVSQLYDDLEHKDQRTRVVAYERAMNELVMQQPADTEALIFYAISLTASAPPTDKTYANQLKAGSILEPLWAKQPNHPGLAHYIIHTYDNPALADKARAAAQRYASIAPSAAHALHMPSHTFTRVGMWKESVNTNNRSIEVALSNGALGEALHASDYAMYAYLQMGKNSNAKAILDGLPTLATRFNPNAVIGAAPGSAGVFALAAIPARWVLERSAWSEAAALEPKASPYPYTEAMTYFARALGASHTGDLAKAKASIDSLASIQQRLSAKGEGYWAEQVAIQNLAAQAWLDHAEKRDTEALARMREAAAREDATEKSAVTPGPLAPARELLGDMLVDLNRPAEASVEYRATLQKEPNRRHSANRLSASSRTGISQGVRLPTIDPAVVARLNALAHPVYRAAWRDTVGRPTYDKERIAVLISSRDCIGGRDARFVPALRAALRLMADASRHDSVAFSATGVAIDWEPDSGAVYLRKLADFDQWIVGQNWANDAAVRLVWRDSTGVPAVPQLLVLERSIGERPAPTGRPSSVPYFGPEKVMVRFLSANAIANWVLQKSDAAIGKDSQPRVSH